MPNKKVQKHKYHQWGDDRFRRETWWKKSDYNVHTERHFDEMIGKEQVFFETLKDPDIVFIDKNSKPDRCVYYKYDAFTNEGVVQHSKVVAIDKPNLDPLPTKRPYVQIITAHPRPEIKENKMKNVTVKYEKAKENNE